MFVRLLGPVAAGPWSDEVVQVTGQISAAVLAQLAVAEGRWVSSDALVDAVWDEAPSSARNAVQVAVSKLRKQFGSDLVLSSAHGYAIDSASVTTDWQQAARLVVDARRHLDLGDPSSAADRAAAALDLFRGEPLLGLTSRSADAIRRNADELLSTAREMNARALLAMNRPDDAAAAIQPTCETDPLTSRLKPSGSRPSPRQVGSPRHSAATTSFAAHCPMSWASIRRRRRRRSSHGCSGRGMCRCRRPPRRQRGRVTKTSQPGHS